MQAKRNKTMKTTLDDTLDTLAHSTHSPRSQYAATDQNYQSLLNRIPAEQRPAIGQQYRKPHPILTRWSAAAACLLLIVGIAIAGIWYHQYYAVPTAQDGLPTSEQTSISPEPRTLVYENAPLADIVAELSAIYHTPILLLSPELGNYCITATFSTDESLPEILSLLAEIGNFEVRTTPDGFILE